MKKLRKILCVTMICIMSMNFAVSASAATINNYSIPQKSTDYSKQMETALGVFKVLSTSPSLYLEKNKRYSDYRHIKVTWTKVENANCYQIQIADNPQFENSRNSIIPARIDLYYNFSINENIDDTYYIRIRPAVDMKSYTGDYYRIYGYRWSPTIVAE